MQKSTFMFIFCDKYKLTINLNIWAKLGYQTGIQEDFNMKIPSHYYIQNKSSLEIDLEPIKTTNKGIKRAEMAATDIL